MKKFLCGFLIGAMIFSMIGVFAASYVANPVDFKVLVNGKEFVSDPPALEVNGRTYLPLRAMGEALGVPVTWNEELRQAEVGNTNSNITSSLYMSYTDHSWCPDFGLFTGKELYTSSKADGSTMYLYRDDGVTSGIIAAYCNILASQGFAAEQTGTGYIMSNADKTNIMLIALKEGLVWVYVYEG